MLIRKEVVREEAPGPCAQEVHRGSARPGERNLPGLRLAAAPRLANPAEPAPRSIPPTPMVGQPSRCSLDKATLKALLRTHLRNLESEQWREGLEQATSQFEAFLVSVAQATPRLKLQLVRECLCQVHQELGKDLLLEISQRIVQAFAWCRGKAKRPYSGERLPASIGPVVQAMRAFGAQGASGSNSSASPPEKTKASSSSSAPLFQSRAEVFAAWGLGPSPPAKPQAIEVSSDDQDGEVEEVGDEGEGEEGEEGQEEVEEGEAQPLEAQEGAEPRQQDGQQGESGGQSIQLAKPGSWWCDPSRMALVVKKPSGLVTLPLARGEGGFAECCYEGMLYRSELPNLLFEPPAVKGKAIRKRPASAPTKPKGKKAKQAAEMVDEEGEGMCEEEGEEEGHDEGEGEGSEEVADAEDAPEAGEAEEEEDEEVATRPAKRRPAAAAPLQAEGAEGAEGGGLHQLTRRRPGGGRASGAEPRREGLQEREAPKPEEAEGGLGTEGALPKPQGAEGPPKLQAEPPQPQRYHKMWYKARGNMALRQAKGAKRQIFQVGLAAAGGQLSVLEGAFDALILELHEGRLAESQAKPWLLRHLARAP